MKSDITPNPAWERLSEVIGYSGLSVNAFAKAIGLKRGENLYQIKKGNNGISPNLAKRINRVLPCFSVAWLIFGEGVFEAEKPILCVDQSQRTSIRIIPFYLSLDALKEKPKEPHHFVHLSAELCRNACYAVLMTERNSGRIETIFLLGDKAPSEPEDNLGAYRICGTITNYR
jgi:hypothetical protein